MELDPQDPKFVITIDDEKLVCTPQNTLAFVHSEGFKDVDHIFRHLVELDDEEEQGVFVWRKSFGVIFNDLVASMVEVGFTVIEHDEPEDFDWGWYVRTHTKDLENYWEHLDGTK
jgi:hypothetical protein